MCISMHSYQVSGKRMVSRRDRIRMNVEDDRLSSLPDELIHKILSFISVKHAIETSLLSSRWRFIWTSLPYLNFSNEDFPTANKFGMFVNHVLSSRDNQIEVPSVKLSLHGKVSHVFVSRIMNYAFSHNVQELTVTCLLEKKSELSLSQLSSRSLEHLTLTATSYAHSIKSASTWELPALTTLHLDGITLSDKCIGLFSKCTNLKNLTLNCCRIVGPNVFNICHPRLSDLTLKNRGDSKVMNVVAPQLKNLTIIKCYGKHQISAPDLASLLFKGYHPLQLSTSGFHSLEKVDLCISNSNEVDTHKIVCLLQQLHTVKYLTLNLEIIELLSSSVEVISDQPSPFANLMSLKIYPAFLEEQAHKKVTMSGEVNNFLLHSSPRATFTLLSREDVRAVRDAASAQNLMTELQVLLETEKDRVNRAHVEKEPQKAQMKRHTTKMHDQSAQPESEMHLDVGGRMTEIERYWDKLNAQMVKGKVKTSRLILKLRQIEWLLKRLPTLQRAKLQTRFSSLCAEADTIMNDMIDGMKIICDKKPSCLNVSVHELA